jgi:hypothetical protein
MCQPNAALVPEGGRQQSTKRKSSRISSRVPGYQVEKHHDQSTEWEAYCHGSHNYRHTPKIGSPEEVKVASAEAVGTWDPLMTGAR